MSEIQEIYNAVVSINEELSDYYEQTENHIVNGESYEIYLCLETIGFITMVTYVGFIIWRDDDDEREFYENKNEYEPIENFLRKKVNEINKIDVKKIKL